MICIENLTFGYKKNKPVLENLNLELKPGSIYGLLGKNGVGKSTLLYNMMGLVFPESGKIDIMGFEPKNRKPSFLSDVFFVPEEVELPSLSIETYLKFNASFYPKFEKKMFQTYLDEFEIPKDLYLNRMSFGQQKKLRIAFGLACNTNILFLDEPTNGLDIPSKSVFRKLLSTVINNENLILISTHQVRDLDNLIDKVIILSEKELLLNASLDEITEKLCFKTSNFCPADTLYFEESLKGVSYVSENKNKEEGKVNFEQLFAASIQNPTLVKSLFGKKSNLNNYESII